jgi:hypothetical protein
MLTDLKGIGLIIMTTSWTATMLRMGTQSKGRRISKSSLWATKPVALLDAYLELR